MNAISNNVKAIFQENDRKESRNVQVAFDFHVMEVMSQ